MGTQGRASAIEKVNRWRRKARGQHGLATGIRVLQGSEFDVPQSVPVGEERVGGLRKLRLRARPGEGALALGLGVAEQHVGDALPLRAGEPRGSSRLRWSTGIIWPAFSSRVIFASRARTASVSFVKRAWPLGAARGTAARPRAARARAVFAGCPRARAAKRFAKGRSEPEGPTRDTGPQGWRVRRRGGGSIGRGRRRGWA